MRIKPKHGYYDITHYPYGGCFRRAGKDGVNLADIIGEYSTYNGGGAKESRCATDDGRIVVVNAEYIER